jgi:hypothetical protein
MDYLMTFLFYYIIHSYYVIKCMNDPFLDYIVIHFEIIYVWETRSQAHHLSRLAALASGHSRRR